jgi:hypothetical protein
MVGAALLKALEDAGIAVLTLTEGLEDDELLGSRLTRVEVTRQLCLLFKAAAALPRELQQGMPEIDWAGLAAAATPLQGPAGPERDDALLFATRSLAPAALMWLRVYRQQHPDWFAMQLA